MVLRSWLVVDGFMLSALPMSTALIGWRCAPNSSITSSARVADLDELRRSLGRFTFTAEFGPRTELGAMRLTDLTVWWKRSPSITSWFDGANIGAWLPIAGASGRLGRTSAQLTGPPACPPDTAMACS